MDFSEYQFLWPPRPEKAIPRALINFYEKRGFIAQVKKNGTQNVLAVSPSKTIHAMTRHNETHKLWKPTDLSSLAFKQLPGDGWYVFVTELLHSKVANGTRDTNYINDILVCDGKHLVGMTYQERMDILHNLFPNTPVITDSSHVINSNTTLARCHTGNFVALFDSLRDGEDEGLVFKNPKARLAYCSRQTSNVDWLYKCRRLTKNYGF